MAFLVVMISMALASDYDQSLFPKAYGVLVAENLLYPVDMGNWPVKIDTRGQLFVDDYLIRSTSQLTRQFHKLKRH